MIRSLQAQIAWDAENLVLGTEAPADGFSESVEYLASGSFAALPIQVVIEPDQSTQQDADGDEERQERIKVYCQRHATKGIADPQLQDQLTRTDDARPYVFGGEIVEANQAAWVLVFWRDLRTGRGARG